MKQDNNLLMEAKEIKLWGKPKAYMRTFAPPGLKGYILVQLRRDPSTKAKQFFSISKNPFPKEGAGAIEFIFCEGGFKGYSHSKVEHFDNVWFYY